MQNRELPKLETINTILNGIWGIIALCLLIIYAIFTDLQEMDYTTVGSDPNFSPIEKREKGVVLDIESTGFVQNGVPIILAYFTTADQNNAYKWVSIIKKRVKPGDEIEIETHKNDSNNKRILGGVSEHEKNVRFIIIFGYILLLSWLWYHIDKGLKILKFIQTGLMTKGQVVSRKKAGRDSNDNTIYRFSIRYTDHNDEIKRIYTNTSMKSEFKVSEWVTIFYTNTKKRETLISPDIPYYTSQYIETHWK